MNSLPTVLTVATACASLVVNWLLVAFLIRYAPRIGLLDRPNARSLHTKVTPRGGGVGLVLVLALGMGAVLSLGAVGGGLRFPLIFYLGAALFVASVSLRDDFKSLSAGLRFFCQLGVAIAAVAGVATFKVAWLPLLGPVHFGWASGWLTIIWIIGLTNVYNFMDGIDGIAGVQGVIAGLAWTAAGAGASTMTIALLGILITTGCLAFLWHNWSPAKIFMGDVGSAFLGYSFAVLPLLLLRSQQEPGVNFAPERVPVFAVLVVWPFIGDGFYTFLRRVRRSEAVWKPHRSHLYQRLAQSGWSHRQVSSLYAAWGVVSALAGLCWLGGRDSTAFALNAVSLAALPAVFLLVSWRERRAVAR